VIQGPHFTERYAIMDFDSDKLRKLIERHAKPKWKEKDEEWWRSRTEKWRGRLQSAYDDYERVRLRYNHMATEFNASKDPDKREKLKTELVSQEELTKYKRSTKKNLISSMKSNSNMASMLTNSEVLAGDWRALFDEINKVEAVTADDIQRVAKIYLVKKNRTVGEIVPEEASE